MKHTLAIILLCTQFTGFAQKDSLTLYAYEQKVSPGLAPAKTSQTNTQYYIFLLTPPNKVVDPVSLWINGKLFGVKVKEAKAPVKRQSAIDSIIMLVPETEQKVLRLFPIKTTMPGNEQKGGALARQNELVLLYKLKGRFHYMVKERMDQLDAVNMQ